MNKENELIRKLIEALVESEIEFQKALENTANLDFGSDFEVDTLGVIADFIGVPVDNTSENWDEIIDTWPDWAYCRDWVYESIGEIAKGRLTIDLFISNMEEEAKRTL